MGIRWGPGVIVLALVAIGCVPTPVGYRSAAPATRDDVAVTPQPTPAGPTPSLAITNPTPLPSPPFTLYAVRKGDTLTSVAKKFGTTARSLAYWNRVTYPSLDPESTVYKPNRLELGWILQLLPNRVVDPEDLPSLSPAPTPVPSGSPTPSGSAAPSPSA